MSVDAERAPLLTGWNGGVASDLQQAGNAGVRMCSTAWPPALPAACGRWSGTVRRGPDLRPSMRRHAADRPMP